MGFFSRPLERGGDAEEACDAAMMKTAADLGAPSWAPTVNEISRAARSRARSGRADLVDPKRAERDGKPRAEAVRGGRK